MGRFLHRWIVFDEDVGFADPIEPQGPQKCDGAFEAPSQLQIKKCDLELKNQRVQQEKFGLDCQTGTRMPLDP